jgi:hypothetical protein
MTIYSNPIENPAAYSDAIKRRMIRNGIKGRLQRIHTEAPNLVALVETVIEPRRVERHAKHEASRQRDCLKQGYDFHPHEYSPLFDLRPDHLDSTASFADSVEWSEMDWYSFPEQLVLRYLKTKKGLSDKQWAWVDKMVAEEPQRAEKAEERKAARQAADAASEHVGTIGERLRDVPVTVEFSKTLDGGAYGPKRIVKMRDNAGNLLVTFGTSEWLWSAEKGERYMIAFTPKEHSEYEGAKQTIVTRTKALREG